MKIIIRLLGYIKPYKFLLFLAYLCLFLSTGFSLITPIILGKAIDAIIGKGEILYLVGAGALLVLASVIRGIFAYGQSYLGESLSQKVAYDLRNALYDHLQRLSFAYHDRQQTGQLMSRATADVEGVRWFIGMGIIRGVYLIVLFLSICLLLFTTNWRLALIAIACLPIVSFRAIQISTRLRGIWQRVQLKTGELGTIIQESLSGIRVVKAYSREEFERKKFADKSLELSDENLKANQIQSFNSPLMNFIFVFAIGLTLLIGGGEVVQGRLTPGELAQFILYLQMLMMPVRMLGFVVNTYSRAVSSGERIFEVLDTQSLVKEKPKASNLSSVKGHVCFENVSFNYNPRSPALKNISFEATQGQVTALLGATGSGKTTVVHLLPRFYDVTEGRITIDSIDIRDVSLASLRKNVGIVQQDVFLFSATIKDNIAYGKTSATTEEIVEAAKIARLQDFIMSLPHGYETWVGERGITLSGGQKQRLAIARTLLMNPKVLILDDSTSSVDTETEYLIQQALKELIKGRTTFIIAQRLSTVKSADLILVLKDGEIVERGKHEELLGRHGIYREIYDLQLRPQEEALALKQG